MAAIESRTIHIIGVRMDLGGGRRGVDMGPSALRIAGIGERLALLGHNVFDHGDVDTPIPETRTARDEKKRYIKEIAKVCQKVYQLCGQALAKGGVPAVLGANGVEKVVEFKLDAEEQAMMDKSVAAVKGLVGTLK